MHALGSPHSIEKCSNACSNAEAFTTVPGRPG